MNLKNALINRIKTESPLSVYLREYFNISNTKLFEINQEYINFLLKYDKAYYKDIESFINHSNSFLIDSLLNLKQLSPFHLEKIYLSKLNLQSGHLGHKGYFFFNDPVFDFNFISNLFEEIEQIKEKEEVLEAYVIEKYKAIVGKDKVESIRNQIEFDFLKQNNLLDTDSKTQKEVLEQQEFILDKKIKDFIFNEYAVDIKTKIFDQLHNLELETKVFEKEQVFLFLKHFEEENQTFSLDKIQKFLSKTENIVLKNMLKKMYNKFFFYSFAEHLYKELKIKDSLLKDKKNKKNIDKSKSIDKFFKENKENIVKFEKLVQEIDGREYLFLNLFEYLGLINTKTDGINNKIDFNIDNKKISELFCIKEEDFSFLNKYDELFLGKLLKKNPDSYKQLVNKKTYLLQNRGKIIKDGKKQLGLILDKLLDLNKNIDINTLFWNEVPNSDEGKDILKFIYNIASKSEDKKLEANFLLVSSNILDSQRYIEKQFKDQGTYQGLVEEYLLGKYKVELRDSDLLIKDNKDFKTQLIHHFQNKKIKATLDKKEYNNIIKTIKKDKDFFKEFIKEECLNLGIGKDITITGEELYLLYIYITKQEELKKETRKSFVKKLIYDKLIATEKILLDSLVVDCYENEQELKEFYDLSFKYIIDFNKINLLINSFFLKNQNITAIYISNILKNLIYLKVFNISFLDNLMTPKSLTYVAQLGDEEKIYNLLKTKDNIIYFQEYFSLEEQYREGCILFDEYTLKKEGLDSNFVKKHGDNGQNEIDYIRKGVVTTKNKSLLLFNIFKQQNNKQKTELETILDISKTTFSLLNKAKHIKTTDIEKIIKVLKHIKQAEEVELLYLIHYIVFSNAIIEKGENFLTITIGNRVFIILSKIDINTINNSVLFVQDRYPNYEHIFVFVNADIFYFIFDKINTKLNIFGITVLSRNILSYMYYHKKVSDLDFYGSKEKNLSRIKMRVNGTYKHIKWSNGSQDQYIFTFNELENFISDMFALGATIGDTAVEDPVFTIGGVKFRTSIMRDGDDISISIRKTEHTATLFNHLKEEELEKKMKDLYGLTPCIYKIFVPSADVTLEMSYSAKDIDLMKAYAEQDRGIFLIIGKTRSGKSTSVRNLLDYIYDSNLDKGKEVKIVTLEDPIESKNINYNQIQVKSDPKAFQQMIKGIKRQDPDLLLVGEIRDSSTLLQTNELANMMSTFSTMHITNPLDGLFTLKGYAVQNNIDLMDIINVLKIIVSQKLLNRTNVKKVSKTIEEIGKTSYTRLKAVGIFLYETEEEIEIFLKSVATDWLNSILSRSSGDQNIGDAVDKAIEAKIDFEELTKLDFDKEYSQYLEKYHKKEIVEEDLARLENINEIILSKIDKEKDKEQKKTLETLFTKSKKLLEEIEENITFKEKTDLDIEYDLILKKYNENLLGEEDKLFVDGFFLFAEKTWELYKKQGYLIRDIHERYTIPKLYYDYLHNKFLNANLDLVLKLSDKDTPIKLVKTLFVESFELKEEKAIADYFDGGIPFFGEGLNKLDTQFYPFILKKIVGKNRLMEKRKK